MKELGIQGNDEDENHKKGVSESRIVSTPMDKSSKLTDEPIPLSPKETTMYRGIVARMNYLGQDRTDIQNTIKELGKDLAGPTNHSIVRAKRLMRYLKGAPRLTIMYRYQMNPKGISTWSDSDFAGCEKSRKSTSGGVLMHGEHLIKSWSVNQSVIASSGEAEYYAWVKSATIALGVQSLCADLGVIYIYCPHTIKIRCQCRHRYM